MQATTVDKTFGLAIPPLDAVSPEYFSVTAVVAIWVCNFIFFLYCLKHFYDTKRPVLLLFMLGGLLTFPVETVADVLGSVWFGVANLKIACVVNGRPLPWWVPAMYVAYFGIFVPILYLLLTKGVTRRQMWWMFIISGILEFILEELWLVRVGAFYYYGNQPLKIGYVPLYWPFVNSLGVLLPASFGVVLVNYLRGWRLMLVPILSPMGYFATLGFTGLPAFIVINNQSPSWLVTQIGGLATIALTLMVTYALSLVVCTDSPWEIRKRFKSTHP